MKEFALQMIQAIVTRPIDVKVTEVSSPETVVLQAEVAHEDLGRVIGKEGRNAKALRTLLNAAAGTVGRRVVLEIRN